MRFRLSPNIITHVLCNGYHFNKKLYKILKLTEYQVIIGLKAACLSLVQRTRIQIVFLRMDIFLL